MTELTTAYCADNSAPPDPSRSVDRPRPLRTRTAHLPLLPSGVAHVSFAGGGIFLPARDVYDRQSLIEHVAARVRSAGLVQVLINDERWLVRFPAARCTDCASCGRAVEAACSAPADGQAYCVACVLTI